MVIAAFPVAKLGGLLLRQVSKPIANFAKERAKSHPFFRRYVCMPPAQFYNWCEIKMKMWIMNLGKPVDVPKLNEAMAIELGANLLGEGIIFIIAAALIFNEYTRSVRKELAKEEARKKEMCDIQQTIIDLHFQTEKQNVEIRELMRAVGDLQTKLTRVRPFGPPREPSSGSPSSSGGSSSSSEGSQILNYSDDMIISNSGIIASALDYITYALPNNLIDP